MSSTQDEPKPTTPRLDDKELEKLAVEELLREAQAGAARAEVQGPSGWVKSTTPRANKKFLCNTLRHAVASNRYHQIKNERKKSSSRHSPKRERSPLPKKEKSRSKY